MPGCCATRPPRMEGDGVSIGSARRDPPVVELGPRVPTVLHTGDVIPKAMRRVHHTRSGHTLRVYKSDYPANAPSEDRHTIAIADDSVFAGVWDGHGGNGSCAEYVDAHVYEEFGRALEVAGEPSRAFEQAFAELDRNYTRDAEQGGKLEEITAGTCAVGVHVELSQRGGTVTCGNLGDSRVVYGRWDGDAMLHAVPLSSDHAATNAKERARLRAAFEDMRVIQLVGTQEDFVGGQEGISDLAVLGICRFTRSLGDCHMKTVSSAAAFNSYQTIRQTGLEIPIAPLHRAAAQGVGYISNVPETFTTKEPMQNGFLIIASDGVWDEMSSSEAVRTVARLLHESKAQEAEVESEHGHKQDQDSGPGKMDVAQLFVEEVLKRATFRIADEVEGEDDMTLAELKHRPCGKASMARSSLHDDITVIIIDMIGTDDTGAEAQREQWYSADVVRRTRPTTSSAAASRVLMSTKNGVLLNGVEPENGHVKTEEVLDKDQSDGSSPSSSISLLPRQQSGATEATRILEAGVSKGLTAAGPPAVPPDVAAAALTAGTTGAVLAGAGGGNTLSGPPVLGGELVGTRISSESGRSNQQPMVTRPLQIVSSPSVDSVASCDDGICAAEGTDTFHSSPRADFTRIGEEQESLHDFGGGMSRSGSCGGFGGRTGRQRKAKGMSRVRSHQLMDLAALAAEATERHEALYAETQRKSPSPPLGGGAQAAAVTMVT